MPRILAAFSLIIAVMALMAIAGCPADDSANMAEQISAGAGMNASQSAPPSPPGGGAPGDLGSATPGGAAGGGAAATPPAAGGTTAAPPAGGAVGSPASAGTGAGGEKAPAGPVIEQSNLKITPPSYKFTGAGRYEISVNVMSKELIQPGVWRIKALDANKKQVGVLEQYIKVPAERPRRILLANFYCQSLPVSLEFQLTDKKALEAPAGGDKGGAAPGGGGAAAGGGGGGGAEGGPGGATGGESGPGGATGGAGDGAEDGDE